MVALQRTSSSLNKGVGRNEAGITYRRTPLRRLDRVQADPRDTVNSLTQLLGEDGDAGAER